jgi:hypothetical protein
MNLSSVRTLRGTAPVSGAKGIRDGRFANPARLRAP